MTLVNETLAENARLNSALLAFARLTDRFEGVSPTVREFTDELGLKTTSLGALWLERLEKAGFIYCPAALRTLGYRKNRALRLSALGIRRISQIKAAA